METGMKRESTDHTGAEANKTRSIPTEATRALIHIAPVKHSKQSLCLLQKITICIINLQIVKLLWGDYSA